jgi:hypothetical protein
VIYLASKVEQAKTYLDELRKKIVDSHIEITEWKIGGGGTDVGTTIELSIKLLVPKQKK